MDLIRTIRNEMAHNTNPVSFDSPEIADRCKKLRESIPGYFRPETSTPKEHFFAVVHVYSTALDWLFIERIKFDGDPGANRTAFEKSPLNPSIMGWLDD